MSATTAILYSEAESFFNYSAYDDLYNYAKPASPPDTPPFRPAKKIKTEPNLAEEVEYLPLLTTPTSITTSSSSFETLASAAPILENNFLTPPTALDDVFDDCATGTPTTTSLASLSPPNTTIANDFFVEFDSSLLSICNNADHWTMVANEMRRQVFNSTGVAFPASWKLLQKMATATDKEATMSTELKRERLCLKSSTTTTSIPDSMPTTLSVKEYYVDTDSVNRTEKENENDAPTVTDDGDEDEDEDPLMYRKLRSESLLMRLIHHHNLDLQNQVSLMRLAKGIFVHHKWQPGLFHTIPSTFPTIPITSSTLSPTYTSSSNNISLDTRALTVNTSGYYYNYTDAATPSTLMNATAAYNNMTQKMLDEDTYIPYSYTFGVRYTHPYQQARDVAIRGRLPLWSQTLFLSECVRQQETRQLVIQPNVPYAGLFPFAPHVTVTFSPICSNEDFHSQEALLEPELTLAYEKMTMDLVNAIDFLETSNSELEQQQQHRQRVLSNMLVCYLADDISQQLTDLATIWAASKGIFV